MINKLRAAILKFLLGTADLRVKRTSAHAIFPTRGTSGSAGLDLYVTSTVEVFPGEVKKVPTGLAFAIPENFVGLIKPRSSTFSKNIDISGVIDSDYRGEVWVVVQNHGPIPFTLESGKCYAQMVIIPYLTTSLVHVRSLDSTVRADGGFGSTS